MKKSEILKEQSAEEDNDLKAMGIGKQIIREERKERFEEKWLPMLQKNYTVSHIEAQGKYRIVTEKFGNVEYYPKANSTSFVKKGMKAQTWRKPGLRWIVENLLNFGL